MATATKPQFDAESTIIKPTPGGARRAPVFRLEPPRSASAVPAQAISGFEAEDLARGGVPPLVAAALPLLNLTGRLRTLQEAPDLDALRTKTIQAIKTFERKALAAGIPPERARPAHYALCATLDDVVLNASWGTYSLWARQGMVSTFHMDVTGGERFFDLLEHLHKDPGTNRDVLLLMYDCLSIGFEGRMRVHPQGHLEVARIREGLYRTLRRETERELSPEWRGVAARHRPLPSSMVLWTIAAATLLVLIAGFFLLEGALDRRSDVTLEAFLSAAPHAPASLRPSPPVASAKPEAAATAPAKPAETTLDRLTKRFGPEVSQGLLSIAPVDLGTLLRIRNRGLFASGSATVEPNFLALLNRIGEALHGEDVQILVVGHTDNVPIHTARFPDNFHLSEGRAHAVADLLGHHIDPFLIRAEGRGALEPVESNDTAAGREQNRRTDIVVIARSGAPKP